MGFPTGPLIYAHLSSESMIVGKRPPPPLVEILVGLGPGNCAIGELCGGRGPFIPRAKENYFTMTFAESLYFQREPIIQVTPPFTSSGDQ